jgi:hypothetical protein
MLLKCAARCGKRGMPMESFKRILERLSRQFLEDVVAAVEAEAAAGARETPRPAAPRRVIRRVVRSEPVRAPEPAVVISSWEIPVGRPRARRSRPRRPRVPRPPAPPKQQVVKFEVVPHPERANRRMVFTRVSTA